MIAGTVRATGRPTLRALPGLLLVLALVAAACGGGTPARPRTRATLDIVAPEPNTTTAPDITLQLRLRHAELVPSTSSGGKVDPRRGHIHVSVDGRVIAMASNLEVPVSGLTPGEHTIQAEFVATDHLPFANDVLAAVTFTVA
jgi:hypothetical protein